MLLFSLSLVVAACSPSRTGMNGNTLTTNARPYVSMTANAPLALQGTGRLWISGEVTSKLSTPLVSLDYALFSDNASGPVTNSAHIFLAKIQDSTAWYFTPDSWPLCGIVASGLTLGADVLPWPSRIIKTPAAGDWISEMWRANGRNVPEYWIVKRWAAILDSDTKAIMEYREPWPDCLEEYLPGSIMFSGDNGQCLHHFLKRSAEAFSVGFEPAAFPNGSSLPPGLKPSGTMPATKNLIGEISRYAAGGDNDSWEP